MSQIFFTAWDPKQDPFPLITPMELWVSDGTAAGTHLAKDIYPGVEGSDPESLTAGSLL